MRKTVVFAFILSLFSCATVREDAVEKPYMETLGKGITQPLEINYFTFTSMFVEDLVFRFKLDTIISDKDIVKLAKKAYKNAIYGYQTKLHIPEYQDGKELYLIINPARNQVTGLIDFILIANYDQQTNTVIESSDIRGDFWAKRFVLYNDELVGASFFSDDYKTPTDTKTITANDYLFDKDKNNDSEIEGLLLSDLNDADNNSRAFTKIVLIQYYMKTLDMKKAGKHYDELDPLIDDYLKLYPKSNIGNIKKLTNLEMEIMRASMTKR